MGRITKNSVNRHQLCLLMALFVLLLVLPQTGAFVEVEPHWFPGMVVSALVSPFRVVSYTAVLGKVSLLCFVQEHSGPRWLQPREYQETQPNLAEGACFFWCSPTRRRPRLPVRECCNPASGCD